MDAFSIPLVTYGQNEASSSLPFVSGRSLGDSLCRRDVEEDSIVDIYGSLEEGGLRLPFPFES